MWLWRSEKPEKQGLGGRIQKLELNEPNRDTMECGIGVAWVIRMFYDQCFRGHATSKVYHVPTKFSREKAFCAVEKCKVI